MALRSVIIIGAGMAGLAAGVYAQRNEYDTTILEMHDKPGGLCTGWQRKGYTFEGCIHALAGTKPDSRFGQIMRELGVDFSTYPAINHPELTRIEDESGKTLVLYTDPDKLEAHLRDLAPADTALISEWMRAIRKLGTLDFFGAQAGGRWDMVKMLPHLPVIVKWAKVTLGQFADRFTDPFVRRAMRYIQYSMPFLPAVLPLIFLTGMRQGDLGFPKGGALPFVRAIEGRFVGLGGTIRYRAAVAKILVEDYRAVGVRLADGTEQRADVIVSAADGRTTIFDMLEGKYLDASIQNYYTKRVPQGPQAFAVHVAFGVGCRVPSPEGTHGLVLLAGTGDGKDASGPMIAGLPRDRLDLEVYNFDPSLAPAGKSVIKAIIESDYDYWHQLRSQGPDAYRAAKYETATAVLDWISRRFPGIREHVEAIDVATPLTTERYTGNWRGAQAWGTTDNATPFSKGFTRTLPGLTGFHMVGQWAEATIGITTAAAAGRRLAQRLCREDGKRFRSE